MRLRTWARDWRNCFLALLQVAAIALQLLDAPVFSCCMTSWRATSASTPICLGLGLAEGLGGRVAAFVGNDGHQFRGQGDG